MGVISSGLLFNRAKIRKYRKAQGISQEQLAERIGVSVTHMSHIETGNTKLSLSVFVAIADSLNVRTDDLLSDGQSGADPSRKEIEELLKGCTIQQMRVIRDIVKAAKIAFRKYMSE